jgi:phosphoesterase RecJ-like protein
MFAAINLVDETYPATAQLIYDLLKIWGVPITADVAACLFTGIYTDTGGFQYEPSNWETFRIVGELAKVYPAFGRDISILENSNEPDKLFFRALAYDSIQILFGGRVALSAVSREQLSGKKIDSRYASISDISSGLRSVKGWDLDIAMLEKEGESCRVSLRTRDTTIFDLTKLAIALGGGGHKASSGATIRLPFVEAKKVLLETIQKVYPFLGRP